MTLTAVDTVVTRRNSTLFRRMSAQAMGMEADSLCHKSHWVPKSSRSKCANCARAFKLFKAKHHCRLCGEVVCGSCSNKRILFRKKGVRTCDGCVDQGVQVISLHNRRNSSGELIESDLSSDESPVAQDQPLFSPLNKRRADHELKPKSSLRAQFQYSHSAGEAAVIYRQESWRTQVPYAMVLFLMTVAGITNILALL